MQARTFRPDDVIEFWIGAARHDPEKSQKKSRLWFNSNPASDKKLERKFGSLLSLAEQATIDHWSASALGSLALVILLDQFSRNIYRGTARAFQNDAKALQIAIAAVDKTQDLELSLVQRAFLYLPFEHAETLAAQDRSVKLFGALERAAPDSWLRQMRSFADHARSHRKIVIQFGRYPHRNKVLRRENSTAEQHYLAKDGKQFGQ